MMVFSLFKKELRAYFGSPLAYVTLGISLGLAGFFFYTDLVFFIIWGGVNLPAGLWLYFFLDVRFVMFLLIPVLTMRLLAEERRLGTMELLRNYPVRDLSILLGKFLAALSVFVVMLVFTFIYPLLLRLFYPVEWAPILAGYLGLLLLGIAFIAVGVFISSLTESQVVAAIGTFGTVVFFWFMAWNEPATGDIFGELLSQISLFDRFYNFAQGVIDSQEVTFFVCFTLFFLVATWQVLQSERWRGARELGSLQAFLSAPSRKSWLFLAAADLVLLSAFVAVQVAAVRHNQRWDLTPTKEHTLSEQSKKVLQRMRGDVEVTAFYGMTSYQHDDLHNLLEKYAMAAAHFRYQLLPLDRNRSTAEQYGVSTYGGAVVTYRERQKVLDRLEEESLTHALLALSEEEQRVVYFLRGHGENDINNEDGVSGYSAVRVALERENFRVKSLDLAQKTEVLEEAAVVVVSGPQSDLLPAELERLATFLHRGWGILLMIDPLTVPNLGDFLQRYGVVLGDDVVIDPDNRLLAGEPFTPVISFYNGEHPITQDFNLNTLFSVARSVEPATAAGGEDRFAVSLIKTGRGSFAVPARGDEKRGINFVETAARRPGPISVGVVVTVQMPAKVGKGEAGVTGAEGRLVVYGDGDFASNYFLNVLGNRDLFLNTAEWLARREELIATRLEKSPPFPLSRLFLTARQSRMIFWVTVVAEPSLLLLSGITFCWWKKKRGRSRLLDRFS